MRHYSPLFCVCLTQEVVGGDAVVVPDLQHQNSWLSKLRLLQRENGFLLLINHFFLQNEMGGQIYATKEPNMVEIC